MAIQPTDSKTKDLTVEQMATKMEAQMIKTALEAHAKTMARRAASESNTKIKAYYLEDYAKLNELAKRFEASTLL